jgi:pimeloyl-ACP methyl ester carboxylesterase
MLAVPDAQGHPMLPAVWSAAPRDLNLLVHPERLSVGEHEHLVPVGLVPSRKVFGIWTTVHGYDGLLKRLSARFGPLDDGTPVGRDLDATVVGVGYDFRRSIAAAARHVDDEIRERVAHLWPTPEDQVDRVVIVAHSMGGLVARYWITQFGVDRLCRGLVTLGTPHRGAPKALEVLANGIPVKGGGHLRRPREVMRGWEGAFELLPRYRAIHDTTITADPADPAAGPVLRYAHDPALEVPWLTGKAKDAFEVHERIRTGWAALETAPAVFPRIGFGHPTLRACAWNGRDLSVTADAPVGPALGGWAADVGDGTVPTFSGQPLESDKHPRLGLTVECKHGPIAALREVEAIVASFLADPSLAPYHGAQVQAVLALDLDDVHVAGVPVEVTATVRSPAGPLTLAGEAPVAWITVTSIDEASGDPIGAPQVEERMVWDRDAATFAHPLTGLQPGLYEVSVAGEEIAGGLATTQTIEVLADDDLD